MSITLELPEDLENELAMEAANLNLSLPEYIQHLLSTGRKAAGEPRTGRELVEHWQAEGLIRTRADVADSQKYARQLREEAEQRKLV
jgi:hypothetical protein